MRGRRPRLTTRFGNAAFLLLGVALLALGAALIVACQSLPTHPAGGAASATTAAVAAQSANVQVASGDWIPLASSAPADVLAAAQQSRMLQQNLAGSGDHPSTLARLGSPVLVRALQPAGATPGQFPDFYVVPILDASGAATDAAELQLSPAHTAIQVIAIVTYSQAHADGAIAQLTAAQAIAVVQAQQHVALRSGTLSELIYFPADAATLGSGQVTWTGGGAFPADPIWLVPGTDGHEYLVGDDRRTYTPDELPMIELG